MSACVSYLSAFQENSRGSARRVRISFHPISNQTNDSTEEPAITWTSVLKSRTVLIFMWKIYVIIQGQFYRNLRLSGLKLWCSETHVLQRMMMKYKPKMYTDADNCLVFEWYCTFFYRNLEVIEGHYQGQVRLRLLIELFKGHASCHSSRLKEISKGRRWILCGWVRGTVSRLSLSSECSRFAYRRHSTQFKYFSEISVHSSRLRYWQYSTLNSRNL